MVNRATRLDDLRVPPNNRREAFRGTRDGFFSIRINDQWRICFRFEVGNAFDVEIVDYHLRRDANEADQKWHSPATKSRKN